ncbi:MAG TPA: ABC transporter permease [Pyrinomonadaceae bacterium]|jgi:peptide/nickel transport system permease protein
MTATNEEAHAPREAQADSNGGEPERFSLSPEGDETRHGGGRISRTLTSARRRGRLTLGFALIILFYSVAVFADFLAPEEYRAQSRREPSAPPSVIRFRDARGRTTLRPHLYARRLVDPLQRRYAVETERAYPLALFTRGYGYKLFGLLPTDLHLFGVAPHANDATTNQTTDPSLSHRTTGATSTRLPRLHLLGTDALGRDRFSRLLMASRFSLVVGPLGTLLACALGVFLGCLAGYMGRTLDALLMRVADTMMALPALVLILAARAAFPLELPPVRAGVLLVTIFALVGWAEMARLARGLVLSLRRREFVQAAVALGLSEWRVLFRHILPNAARTLVVQATLMLPAFLLAETSLSFLGVGLQEPEPSWGNMLAEASDINLLQRGHALTMLTPALAIFLFVLGVRLVGDGLRNDKNQRF